MIFEQEIIEMLRRELGELMEVNNRLECENQTVVNLARAIEVKHVHLMTRNAEMEAALKLIASGCKNPRFEALKVLKGWNLIQGGAA